MRKVKYYSLIVFKSGFYITSTHPSRSDFMSHLEESRNNVLWARLLDAETGEDVFFMKQPKTKRSDGHDK